MPESQNPFQPVPPEPPLRVAPQQAAQPQVQRPPSKVPAVILGILAGAGVGGLCGAVGRALVGIMFVYMVAAGGGSFFAGSIPPEAMGLLWVSAIIGLLVCGTAGATCRVWIAAPVGALLSALPCFILVVFPSTFLMSMSGGNNEPDVQAVWLALVGMVIVGALASSAGALTGKFVMRRMWPTSCSNLSPPSRVKI